MALKNLAKIQARIAAIPAAVKVQVQAQLDTETDMLVTAMQNAAPVSELEKHPGELRDSIHKYANPDRELSYRIIADATDEKGNFIGSHVEAGHRKVGGKGHVPAQPFFFPVYRAYKKPMRRRMLAAGRKAVKTYTV